MATSFKVDFNAKGIAQKVFTQVLVESAEELATLGKGVALNSVPVDTGALKESIDSRVNRQGFIFKRVSVVVTADSSKTSQSGRDYSAFVEFGTRKMAARPFLAPALDAMVKEAERTLRKAYSGTRIVRLK